VSALGDGCARLAFVGCSLISLFLCTVVSKAFQVLSDASLRAAFDRDGGDPESRFGSGMRPTSEYHR